MLRRLIAWIFRFDDRVGDPVDSTPLLPREGTFCISGPLSEDCQHRGPGVYYLYLGGEERPVYVGKSSNIRHRLRWHRYNLSQGSYPENPPIEQIRWQVIPMDTEPDAWRHEQREIRRIRPRWNGTGMSWKAIRARRQADKQAF